MMEDIATCERNLYKMFEGISKFLVVYDMQFPKIDMGDIKLPESE